MFTVMKVPRTGPSYYIFKLLKEVTKEILSFCRQFAGLTFATEITFGEDESNFANARRLRCLTVFDRRRARKKTAPDYQKMGDY
jgi:hypothetical protein